MNKKHPIVIGVAGGSASGKTTVSRAIFDKFSGHSILLLEEDSYYKKSNLPFAEREKINYDHPLSFDTDLLYQQLQDLMNYKTIEKPVYDYTIHNRSDEVVRVEPKEVIILEGILVLFDQRLRDLMDIKVFVDTDDDIRIIRRIQRDMKERGRTLESVIDQYLDTVKPMYHQFIEPTKRYADIIVPEGGQNQVAIDLLATKIKDILVQRNSASQEK
ncbi:MAG: uridine kinase [Candidatus Paralactobacillus gallistercoris]|uniref:Uridine kinase n=1 Tax=Candidatus Paralactobacillus gallistercoris TaxID=2838724 RepID=A0A948X101_9LACO|nr:uridine kinase [Candidatus Paralactobacillus gallistercoris]